MNLPSTPKWRAASNELWRRGSLRHLLHDGQKPVYDAIRKSDSRSFVLEIARQFGKTVMVVALCCEAAIRNPGRRIVYGAPTLKMLGEFAHPAFELICRSAPADCKPRWEEKTSHYRLPNNAWVHLFGADDEAQASRGRGPPAVFVAFDECGFCAVLPTVIQDVFQPSLQRATGLCELYASTPAPTPDHPFTVMAERAESQGNFAHRTWEQNPLLTDTQRESIILHQAAELGYERDEYVKTAKFRREYLGERVVDPHLAAVPEWEEARKTQLVAVERPAVFRGQEGGDFGGVDPHFWVFGYWHPKIGLVIEDELILRAGETSKQLGDAVKDKERALWGVNTWDGTLAALTTRNLNETFAGTPPDWALKAASSMSQPQPWARWVDVGPLAAELNAQGLLCMPSPKSDKELNVDSFRVLVRQRKLWVHPRCVNLDRHLRATTWSNLKRREWARRGGEHGDGLDAAIFLHRNINKGEMRLDAQQLKARLLGDSPIARRLAR